MNIAKQDGVESKYTLEENLPLFFKLQISAAEINSDQLPEIVQAYIFQSYGYEVENLFD